MTLRERRFSLLLILLRLHLIDGTQKVLFQNANSEEAAQQIVIINGWITKKKVIQLN